MNSLARVTAQGAYVPNKVLDIRLIKSLSIHRDQSSLI